jgi:hypothetical protein
VLVAGTRRPELACLRATQLANEASYRGHCWSTTLKRAKSHEHDRAKEALQLGKRLLVIHGREPTRRTRFGVAADRGGQDCPTGTRGRGEPFSAVPATLP